MLESAQRRKVRREDRPPRAKRRWPVASLVVLAVVLLLAGGVTVYRTQFNHTPGHQELVGIAESFVGLQIVGGLRPVFSPDEETHVERQGEDEYLVQGWVHLIGSEGTSERQAFSCVVHKNSWGDWVGDEINLIPQM